MHVWLEIFQKRPYNMLVFFSLTFKKANSVQTNLFWANSLKQSSSQTTLFTNLTKNTLVEDVGLALFEHGLDLFIVVLVVRDLTASNQKLLWFVSVICLKNKKIQVASYKNG